ncbi:MAG: YfiR family protein [Flavobacteriales bacterium]|nr:YfiR family protein [Flavobacteriales bacterium]
MKRFGMGSAKSAAKSIGTVLSLGRIQRVLLVLPLLLCVAATPQRDAEKDTTAILQANYLYNIAKLVEWKDPTMRSGNFIIGVIGGANLYQELIKQYSTRTIGKQPIEVRKLPRSAEVERCHLLFVGKSDLALLPEIYKRMKDQPTMVITEYAGALEDGSVVNFVKVDNLLKYELSMANAKRHGLVVGLTLKNLAHRVEE